MCAIVTSFFVLNRNFFEKIHAAILLCKSNIDRHAADESDIISRFNPRIIQYANRMLLKLKLNRISYDRYFFILLNERG